MTARDSLWSAVEAARATGGNANSQWVANDISIDSRGGEPGALFIALRGESRDGHAFAADALARGAVAAMVDHQPEGLAAGAPLLQVGDTLAGLNALAVAARSRCAARIVGITGSAGKTGAKEMLLAAFSRQARAHASAASYNNQWGVPLSLSRMPRDTQFAAFEIGMNHAGEITPLTKLVRPDAAIITTIAPAHIGHFKSVADIAEAKAEIFLGLRPDGVAIINRDNEYFDLLASRARDAGVKNIVGFGKSTQATARLIKAVHHSDCSCISAQIGGQPITYKIGFPGDHWAMNSLAVLAAVIAVGGDLALAALALGELTPLAGRGRRYQLPIADGSFTLIDESYNANPGSMHAALKSLASQSIQGRGRRIAVLGDMGELGEETARYHRDLAPDITGGDIHLTFTTGTHTQELVQMLPIESRGGHAPNAGALGELLLLSLRPGDVVMVKGSNYTGMGAVVKALLKLENPDQPVRQAGNGNVL